MSEPKDDSMTCREAGRWGGRRTGLKVDYEAIGQKGGRVTKERYGHAHYVEIGQKGGCETRDRYWDKGHFQKIGKKGGARLKELIERGKAMKEDE